MTLEEKAQAFPGIEITPSDPCIAGTRIPVWLLVQIRESGLSETDLLHNYPTLTKEDLANAWAYARSHVNEIEQQIAENTTAT